MKSAVVLLSLVAAALAQSAVIVAPTAGQNAAPGSNLVVDVEKPDSISPSTDVSVAIGLLPCSDSGCVAEQSHDELGEILFKGDFTPQDRPGSTTQFQNFTIQVPQTAVNGSALLSVAHFFLLGAGPEAQVETLHQVIVIQ